MKRLTRRLLATSMLFATGCGSASFQYVPTTGEQTQPKAVGCDFAILSTPPTREYIELGVLQPNSQFRTKDVQVFRQQVDADVCRAGGDAVLAEINGTGQYVRGTVIRYEQ